MCSNNHADPNNMSKGQVAVFVRNFINIKSLCYGKFIIVLF